MKSNISLLKHGVSLLLVVLGVAMSLTINTCAANSDGSITKTATACDVGHVESTELKHGGSWAFTKTYSYSHTCWKCNWSGTITYNGYKCVGTVTKYYANGDTYTDTCGALGWDAQVCPNCGIQ